MVSPLRVEWDSSASIVVTIDVGFCPIVGAMGTVPPYFLHFNRLALIGLPPITSMVEQYVALFFRKLSGLTISTIVGTSPEVVGYKEIEDATKQF